MRRNTTSDGPVPAGAGAGENCAPGGDLAVLQVLLSTPESREGAVYAGLELSDRLREFASVDTVKMAGEYDEEFRSELDLDGDYHTIPSRTVVRDAVDRWLGDPKDYANASIWTRLRPPKPLESYDLVHLHNPLPLGGFVAAALDCLRAGVPYCVTTHGITGMVNIPENMDMSTPTRLAYEAGIMKPYYAVLRRARHLFALTEADVERLRERFPDQSISLVRNGVTPNPPDADAAAAVEREFGIGPDETVLLFVGRLIKAKGVDELLAVADDLPPECRLVVVGAPQEEAYERRVREADAVTYEEFVWKSRLQKLYQVADLFVFPTRSDVFPLVNLEAMAAETPVVSTTVGGIPEQVTDETGVLVDPRDPDALRDGILGLVDDDERRAELATAALERVEDRFTWRQVARETAATYEEVSE